MRSSLFGCSEGVFSNQAALQFLFLLVSVIYVLLGAWLLYLELPALKKLKSRHWFIWGGCMVASFVLADVSVAFSSSSSGAFHVWPLLWAGVPVALSSVVGVFPAALSGLVAGVAPLIWFSQFYLSPFEMALWGAVVASLIRQDYRGRLAWLVRHPIVAVLAASAALWLARGLHCTLTKDGYVFLAALICLHPRLEDLIGVLIPTVVSGAVVQAAFLAFPSIVPTKTGSRIPPYARSLRAKLLFVFVPSIVIVIIILFWAVNTTAIKVAVEQALLEAARNSENAAERVPFMFQTGQSLLAGFTEDEDIYSSSPEVRERRLSRYIRTMAFFKQLALIGASAEVLSYYPVIAGSSPFALENNEAVLADRAIENGTFQISPVHRLADGTYAISFLSPLLPQDGRSQGVLVGRVDIERAPMMRDLLNSLQNTMTTGVGFVVDDRGLIIAHPDEGELLRPWSPMAEPDELLYKADRVLAYMDTDSSGSRWLIYVSSVAGSTWKTVIQVPYETVLNQAVEISTPLVIVLLAVGAICIVLIPVLGSRLSRPIEVLAKAAARIAQGHLDEPIEVTGDDEVGHLGVAFETMRRSLQTRLRELSFLLKVSQAVSASLDLRGTLEPILAAIMQSTTASHVRIVLLSSQGTPERQVSMRRKDAAVWEEARNFAGPLLRLVKDRRAIKIGDTSVYPEVFVEPSGTALAFPLLTKGRLVGVLVVEYQRREDFPAPEIEFLNTLSGQAAIAIENARLFDAVENERRRLEAILISTNDAIIVTDRDNRVLLVNPAAEHTFGLRVSAVTGRSVLELDTHPGLVELLVKSASESGVVTGEIVLSDGRTLYASASPIGGDSDGPQGYVVVMRDITHFKEIDNMKSEFVATVSHDLRTPLTYMKGYTSLVASSGALNEKQTEYIQKIRLGINQMTELIEDLLDIGRIDAGVGVNMAPCRLDALVGRIAAEMGARARSKGLDFGVEISSGLALVTADETLIRQAIINLIDNAIKYTPNGFVRVHVYQAQEEVVIKVEDSGMGIPAADLPRLFEKFYRVKTREALKMRGTGLGLSIVKSIVTLHKGRVWVESELNRGSAFYVALPVHREDGAAKGVTYGA